MSGTGGSGSSAAAGERTALITGVAGQDGATLSGQLLDKGYRVVGTFRPTMTQDFWRLDLQRLQMAGQKTGGRQ